MLVEDSSDGIISIGEPITKSTGSISLNRVPGGPWCWELVLADGNGRRLGSIELTTVDLQQLRDLLAKAIVNVPKIVHRQVVCGGALPFERDK